MDNLPPDCPECGHPIMDPEDHDPECPMSETDEYDLYDIIQEPTRDWDDVKEAPTPGENERYFDGDHPSYR